MLVHPPAGQCLFGSEQGGCAGVYWSPPDNRFPVVCVDETSKQLVSETRVPRPPATGQPVRCDYKYRHQGVCNLFPLAVPKLGWRTVQVTARRAFSTMVRTDTLSLFRRQLAIYEWLDSRVQC